jgi:N-acetylmuramoyl-L-alanine amidase
MTDSMVNRYFIPCLLLIGLLWGLGRPAPVSAVTAERQFFKAQTCFARLMADEKKPDFRENWFPCIRMFQEAYKLDPSGRYAAASLYMAGKLFQQLYNRSFKSSDKKEALDYFQRVRRRFPDSAYAPKAQKGLAALGSNHKEDLELKEVRVEKEVAKAAPTQPPHKRRLPSYKTAKARYRAQKRSSRAVRPQKPVSRKPAHRPPSQNNGGARVTVTGLRVWSNPSYTRIVVDASEQTPYRYSFLDEDPSLDKPQRLYIDFDNARLGDGLRKIVPINDDLLLDARAGQYRADQVRVVVDIKSFKNYKIFSLRNPFRTVIDVWGRGAGDGDVRQAKRRVRRDRPAADRTPEPHVEIPLPVENSGVNGLARQFALRVNKIVIDPGHGGHDSGAVGYYKHVLEKDIVLALAKRLANKIRRHIGCQVILTRSDDRFITLEERTAIANTTNADLFISLHTNAHRDSRAYGIETYFLNLATDEDAILVAARENATSRKNISDLQVILNDLMKNAKINESSRLAGHVQKALVTRIDHHYTRIKDKGVKQAPFYVLLGAQMPAILVETSFISNKRECNRLTDATYQEHLCNAILDGIRHYIRETNPTALMDEGGRRWGG